MRTAEALYASDQNFDALIEAIRGQRRLERWYRVPPELKKQANAILEQIIINIHASNRLEGHQASVLAVAFSPDGNVLTSVSDDGSLLHWHLAPILSLDALAVACTWVGDYLRTNPKVSPSDRALCPEGHPTRP